MPRFTVDTEFLHELHAQLLRVWLDLAQAGTTLREPEDGETGSRLLTDALRAYRPVMQTAHTAAEDSLESVIELVKAARDAYVTTESSVAAAGSETAGPAS